MLKEFDLNSTIIRYLQKQLSPLILILLYLNSTIIRYLHNKIFLVFNKSIDLNSTIIRYLHDIINYKYFRGVFKFHDN